MRKFLCLAFLSVTSLAHAQVSASLPVVQKKMQALLWMDGKWQGDIMITGDDGRKFDFRQNLYFTFRLKNSLLLLEETIVQGQDTVVQNIGMLTYDLERSQYTIQAHTKEGARLEADVEVFDKKIVWRVSIPGQIVRYTARLNEKGQWHQTGEISADGTAILWKPFSESLLSRVNK
jgi:hypothetical protein